MAGLDLSLLRKVIEHGKFLIYQMHALINHLEQAISQDQEHMNGWASQDVGMVHHHAHILLVRFGI